MGSKPKKVNSVTIPADMLEKIAATNHLAIADVVRLFLVQLPLTESCRVCCLSGDIPIHRAIRHHRMERVRKLNLLPCKVRRTRRLASPIGAGDLIKIATK
jgi:hypothetical protein